MAGTYLANIRAQSSQSAQFTDEHGSGNPASVRTHSDIIGSENEHGHLTSSFAKRVRGNSVTETSPGYVAKRPKTNHQGFTGDDIGNPAVDQLYQKLNPVTRPMSRLPYGTAQQPPPQHFPSPHPGELLLRSVPNVQSRGYVPPPSGAQYNSVKTYVPIQFRLQPEDGAFSRRTPSMRSEEAATHGTLDVYSPVKLSQQSEALHELNKQVCSKLGRALMYEDLVQNHDPATKDCGPFGPFPREVAEVRTVNPGKYMETYCSFNYAIDVELRKDPLPKLRALPVPQKVAPDRDFADASEPVLRVRAPSSGGSSPIDLEGHNPFYLYSPSRSLRAQGRGEIVPYGHSLDSEKAGYESLIAETFTD